MFSSDRVKRSVKVKSVCFECLLYSYLNFSTFRECEFKKSVVLENNVCKSIIVKRVVPEGSCFPFGPHLVGKINNAKML